MKESQVTGLLMAGGLAILGTIAGGIVQGYLENERAEKEFQSNLILHALESADQVERENSLQFLIDAGLIVNPELTDNLSKLIRAKTIPQIKPSGSVAITTDTISVKPIELLNEKWAPLVGLKVWHGDVITAVKPIFGVADADSNEIRSSTEGEIYGSTIATTVTILTEEGYVVTGFDITRGRYFSGSTAVKLQIIWHKITPDGIDASDRKVSALLGTGEYAENLFVEEYRVSLGSYIDDMAITLDPHSDGTIYLREFNLVEKQWSNIN